MELAVPKQVPPATDPLRGWLKQFQNIDPAAPIGDPSRSAGLSDLVQGELSKLAFESEPAAYVRLLESLAPDVLKPGSGHE